MKRFASFFLLLGLLTAGAIPAWAGRKDTPTPAPGASGSPAPKFNIPIPVGYPADGVKIPYFDERGRLQMYFNIEHAFRVDLNHLSMENAYMQTYDEHQAPDANVVMTKSVLDLNTRIVTSDVPVTVRRSDFQIVGQKMTFNTQTRAGHMSGHVTMTIFNRQEMAHASPTPSPASKPGASPQPAANSTPTTPSK